MDLQNTSSHAYDFEIPLKAFRSPSIVDPVAGTSTTQDLEILQGITLVEDLREILVQKPLDLQLETQDTLFSLFKKSPLGLAYNVL